jgi:hypothetical protein
MSRSKFLLKEGCGLEWNGIVFCADWIISFIIATQKSGKFPAVNKNALRYLRKKIRKSRTETRLYLKVTRLHGAARSLFLWLKPSGRALVKGEKPLFRLDIRRVEGILPCKIITIKN